MRLAVTEKDKLAAKRDLFQFQIGAIGRMLQAIVIQTQTSFNSRLVRLAAGLRGACTRKILRFNSRLVRLAGCKYQLLCCLDPQFQFQIGAIGSQWGGLLFGNQAEFQFQIGAIGRLQKPYTLSEVERFQFQIGAIGSAGTKVYYVADSRFNSRLVRLAEVFSMFF